MPTEDEVKAAGIAYWNFWRAVDGKEPDEPFDFDPQYAGAITAALGAVENIAFNLGVEMACRRIEECNDETPLMCRLEAARAVKKSAAHINE